MKNFLEKNLEYNLGDIMNKLMGFLELKDMRLPSIQWKQYTGNEVLSNNFLWTIRSAVYFGNDLNLPRCVGKNAEEAKKFADDLLKELRDIGMVIYYPYFVANKSGTLEVRNERLIIEAVEKDLWNLVTQSDREVTIIIDYENNVTINGNSNFLSCEEQKQLCDQVPEIRKIFRDDLMQGRSVLLEWSYAYSCDNNKRPIGKEYLVFYEIRTVE